MLKRIKEAYTALRDANWNARYSELLGRELFGKILRIVGLGRIGIKVVRSFGYFRKGTATIEQPSVEVTERFALTAHATHTREALSRTAIDVAEAVKTVFSGERTALGKSESSKPNKPWTVAGLNAKSSQFRRCRRGQDGLVACEESETSRARSEACGRLRCRQGSC